MHIAVFDHDRKRAESITRALKSAGYACDLLHSLSRLPEKLAKQPADMLILGPLADWRSLSQQLRSAEASSIPKLLMLVGQDADVLEAALKDGLDDYLCLPLRMHELHLRVSMLARLSLPPAESHVLLKSGEFVFERFPKQLLWQGKPLKVTGKEFDLALLFFTHLGRPLSRAFMAEAVWQADWNDLARTIDTHVSRVRNKLNLKPENGYSLDQIYGFGYQLTGLS